MVVDYAVTVAVDGAGVSNEQLDYLTLQSNRVETSYRTLVARPTAVHVVDSLATEALQKTEPQSGTLTCARRLRHTWQLCVFYLFIFLDK